MRAQLEGTLGHQLGMKKTRAGAVGRDNFLRAIWLAHREGNERILSPASDERLHGGNGHCNIRFLRKRRRNAKRSWKNASAVSKPWLTPSGRISRWVRTYRPHAPFFQGADDQKLQWINRPVSTTFDARYVQRFEHLTHSSSAGADIKRSFPSTETKKRRIHCVLCLSRFPVPRSALGRHHVIPHSELKPSCPSLNLLRQLEHRTRWRTEMRWSHRCKSGVTERDSECSRWPRSSARKRR